MRVQTEIDKDDLVRLTAEIVSAYVGNNSISPHDLPSVISSVHAALEELGGAAKPEPALQLKPWVPIKKSVTPDFLICLEDGKKFKSLKRHLMTDFQMTPNDYRAKWKLPDDYPMVAPNYAAIRSSLAKTNGLGRKAAVAAPPVRRKNSVASA